MKEYELHKNVRVSIPTDWVMLQFGQFASFKNGLNFLSSDKGYTAKIIGVSHFLDKAVADEEDLENVNLSSALRENDILREGDLLFVRSNGNKRLIGRCVIIPKFKQEISHSGFTIRARITNPAITSEYINLHMRSYLTKKQLFIFGGGTNISNLSQDILKRLYIPIAPLEEQKMILKICNTWDNAIFEYSTLLEAKRQYFNRLLHILINKNGKNDGWIETSLGNIIAQIGDGGTPNRNNEAYFGGEIPWVVIEDITFRITKTKECLTESGLAKSSAKLWPAKSVILSTGATIGLVGIAQVPLATKQGITGIIPKDIINSEYLAYYFLANKAILLKYAQGSSFKEIRPETIKKLPFKYPQIDQQKRVVKTLNIIQQEIGSLEELIISYKIQKKGLMQKLLTGHIRVKV